MDRTWFSRRCLGDEVCWDSGHPGRHDQKISKAELGRENGWGGEAKKLQQLPLVLATTCSGQSGMVHRTGWVRVGVGWV